MSEVVRAFALSEVGQEGADATPNAPLRSLGCLPQICFHLAEEQLERIEPGRVFRQVAQLCTGCCKRFSDAGDFVSAEILHHHNIAAVERGSQALLDLGEQDLPIHGARDHRPRRYLVAAEAGMVTTGLGSDAGIVDLEQTIAFMHSAKVRPLATAVG